MKLILIAGLLAAPLLAERVELTVDPAATKVEWHLGASLHTVHGTFRLKKGQMWFDTETGKAGGVLVVDATSGESGNGNRDSKMHKSVLESGRYPEITFIPVRVDGGISPGADSAVELHGLLSIHGESHEIAVRVKGHFDKDRVTATALFRIPYVKWGMKDPGTFLLKVSDSVDVEVTTVGRVAPY